MTTETLTFIDPTGVETPLTSATIDTLWGIAGRFMPGVDFVVDTVPELPGARLRTVKTLPREVAVPLEITEASASDLRVLLRQLAKRLYPARGDGTLRAAAPDGAVRDLLCRYVSGFELTETREDGGVTRQRALLVFRAIDDPFWRDRDPTTLSFSTGAAPTFFPIFPIRLARSSVLGGVTITNLGDVDAWPTWTITGPGSNLTIVNATTGAQLAMSTVLAGGDQVIIDTTPGVKTVTRGGVNLYGDLADGSMLFPFISGGNDITVELDGATVDSAVDISYRARYLTP